MLFQYRFVVISDGKLTFAIDLKLISSTSVRHIVTESREKYSELLQIIQKFLALLAQTERITALHNRNSVQIIVKIVVSLIISRFKFP